MELRIIKRKNVVFIVVFIVYCFFNVDVLKEAWKPP